MNKIYLIEIKLNLATNSEIREMIPGYIRVGVCLEALLI